MAAGTAVVAGLAGAAMGMVGLLRLTLPEAAAPEPGQISPETRLWLGVLTQAVIDANNRGAAPADRLRREQARQWLVEPGHDLHLVLGLINIEPDWWARQAIPALRDAWAGGRGYVQRRRAPARVPAAV